jgi:hypothetical protein
MPKSKRRPPHRKEKKTQVAQSVVTGAGVSQPGVLGGQPKAASPAVGSRSPLSTLTGEARHPYVAGELKRIAILTAVILVVLVILAFALPRFI